MTKKQLQHLLRRYPDMLEKINNINRDIDEIKGRRDDAREISSMVIDGMPHTSTTGNPTLQKVESIIDTFDKEINILLNEIIQTQQDYALTKQMLCKLSDDEYKVILLKYFDNRKWDYIERQIHLSIATCFRLHNKALNKMLED